MFPSTLSHRDPYMTGTQENRHILVVEDDRHIAALLEVYLAGAGYRVTLAESGEAMREVLRDHSVDLVVMDLMLPGEDGFALTRYLRERHRVGIIILTARKDTVDRIVGLEMGADDYVMKPFDERELLARIRSVLRRSNDSLVSEVDSPGLTVHASGGGRLGFRASDCAFYRVASRFGSAAFICKRRQ
ncbi:hypothetical protein CCP2SC5_80040 [Azospirillaceae bacterium]